MNWHRRRSSRAGRRAGAAHIKLGVSNFIQTPPVNERILPEFATAMCAARRPIISNPIHGENMKAKKKLKLSPDQLAALRELVSDELDDATAHMQLPTQPFLRRCGRDDDNLS